MGVVEHPIGHDVVLHRAFAERVVWQTVGVINCRYERADLPRGGTAYFQGIGTGSACCWNGRDIILTAKHVLEGARIQDLRFLLRPSGQMDDWSSRFTPSAASERVELGIENIAVCRTYDLAAIVLNQDRSDRTQLQYCDLPSSFAPVPAPGGGVFLVGYPSDLTVSVASRRGPDGVTQHALGAVGKGCWTTVVGETPRFFPSSYDPGLQFLLAFDPAMESSMPHGYSGAGVWYQGRGTSDLWAARPALAGVQIKWHAESNLMIGVRSDVVREFLESDLG
jgi:hypothetical protein